MASEYDMKKTGIQTRFVMPWMTLPMLGSVRFNWGHEKLVPPQHRYNHKHQNEFHRRSALPLALAALFTSPPAVAVSHCFI
jgi:hypothetical protein